MGMLFKYLISIFEYQLAYDFYFKSIYLIISVFLTIDILFVIFIVYQSFQI